MKEIPLSQGKVAVVDDEDYEFLMQWKWTADRFGNTWCAYRMVYDPVFRPKRIRMHRLIMGNPVGLVVDHVNGNGLDNRHENLRVCTHAENIHNSRLQRNNTTGFKGVDLYKGRYRARIKTQGRRIFIGTFDDPFEAAKAYDVAAKKYFGEFARTNF